MAETRPSKAPTLAHAWLETVRATYQLGGTDAEWLGQILSSASAALDTGHGAWAATYELGPDWKVTLRAAVEHELPSGMFAEMTNALATAPPLMLERTFTAPCGTLAELMGFPSLEPLFGTIPMFETYHAAGIVDSFGVNARDTTEFGCVLSGPLAAERATTADVAAGWGRVAAHIAAVHRLRRRADAKVSLDDADAVVDPSGRVEHVQSGVRSLADRGVLKRIAIELDRALGRAGFDDPIGALSLWNALLAGRWSVVEHFEEDGKRYFVLLRNAPAVEAVSSLTERQRQIVGFASLGHSNQLIAYELGLAESTVSNHLRHALARLGLSSRAALIQLRAVADSPRSS